MQYILSEKEYNGLTLKDRAEHIEGAALCMAIMIARYSKHPCPADKLQSDPGKKYQGLGYCSDCPACPYCPYEHKELPQ